VTGRILLREEGAWGNTISWHAQRLLEKARDALESKGVAVDAELPLPRSLLRLIEWRVRGVQQLRFTYCVCSNILFDRGKHQPNKGEKKLGNRG